MNQGANALSLSNARIGGVVLRLNLVSHDGVDFSFAAIRVLSAGIVKPPNGLPPISNAQGWTLGTVEGFLRSDWKSAADWLDSIEARDGNHRRKEFASQPWKELAKCYDQIGQPEDGRWLRYQAARRTTRVAPSPSKAMRLIYGGLVGYGYYPLIVIGWLAALWLLVFLLSSAQTGSFTLRKLTHPP
ncbi:hypothetical protein GCM10009589_20690 [Arthrobacter pascens]